MNCRASNFSSFASVKSSFASVKSSRASEFSSVAAPFSCASGVRTHAHLRHSCRGRAGRGSHPPRTVILRDERRADDAVMEKRGLTVQGRYAAFRDGPPGAIDYRLHGVPLPDVQWADGSADGRLLVAMSDGGLQIREP